MRVKGIGPRPCRFMIVGEGPGVEEDRKGIPFVGKTGRELDRFLDGIGLPRRSECFLTNLYREYRGKDEYTDADLLRDGPGLEAEFDRGKPEVVITLGRHSTRWFLGDVDMESSHSIPWSVTGFRGRDFTVFPIFHPAAGMHNPEISAWVTYGFGQLSTFLRGALEPRTLFSDNYPEPQYEEITTQASLRKSLDCVPEDANYRAAARVQESSNSNRYSAQSKRTIAVDTEGTPAKPWSLQFSVRPGAAYLIRAARSDLLTAFRQRLIGLGARVAFHNALYDLSMMRAMGIPWSGEFDDTMVMAYLLQVEPQGLKPLCVRHCGMKMQSYDEILGDAGNRLATDYLYSLFDIEELDYEQRRTTAFEAAKAAGRRVRVLPKLPRNLLHKAVERCLQSKEPRKLWMKQIADEQHPAAKWLGAMPEPTLDMVEQKEAVRYGCRDADGTLRLYHQLKPRLEAMGFA